MEVAGITVATRAADLINFQRPIMISMASNCPHPPRLRMEDQVDTPPMTNSSKILYPCLKNVTIANFSRSVQLVIALSTHRTLKYATR